MPSLPLLDAFNLAPEKAIEFFRKKGYAFSWDWTDIWEEAHVQAFTVAKVMRMDILEDIREALDSAMAEGKSFAKFKKELTPVLQQKGWWGRVWVGDGAGAAENVQLGSPWRVKTIFQTNMQSALMAGRYDGMMETVETRPLWEYVAVNDSRTRPEHAALNGLVFQHDDPFWDTHYPPNGFRCRCRVRNRSIDEADRDGLTVSSSKGRLVQDERLVSKRTGLLADVTGYKTASGEVVFTDPGFNFNPGKTAYKPDLKQYPKDLVKEYKTSLKRMGK